MFKELPPSMRTQLRLMSLTMGLDNGANYERISPRLWHNVRVVTAIEGDGDLGPLKVLGGGG
jgi:hypothetical protein